MATVTTETKQTDSSVKQQAVADTDSNEARPVDGPQLTSRAEAIIRRNVLWSLVAGVLPVPLIDFIAIEGVQLKMLKELTDLYGLRFTEDLAKKLVGTLLTSLGSVGVGATLGFGLAKFIPVVGTALGMVSTPIIAGACTNALGKAFMMHFETGGTLLDFDPVAMRSYFRSEFEKSKETVAKVHQEKQQGR